MTLELKVTAHKLLTAHCGFIIRDTVEFIDLFSSVRWLLGFFSIPFPFSEFSYFLVKSLL